MARPKLKYYAWGVAVVVSTFSMLAIGPMRQAYEQRQRIQAEEVKLAALEHQNDLLEQRLERLKDPEYIEKLSRERLGLVKPGEISYVVVSPPEPTTTATAVESKPKSVAVKVKDWFKDLLD